jgi:DGQHR domain-containing protein
MSDGRSERLERISVIVPRNPFITEPQQACLCALDVEKIMEWWPGTPHAPEKRAEKVRAIQRSLDWKRVVHIAAYLLQHEIQDAPELLNKYFRKIYEPLKLEPGREWPPRVNKVIGFEPSAFPSFTNILVHINGAKIETTDSEEAGHLIFDPKDPKLRFTVIDGQHRINGAYLALKILQESEPDAKWFIPSEVFVDLDPLDEPPRIQAQIFIDVNFYQKKVDRSLVQDLFPTTRAGRDPINVRERSQDIGRRLMLEAGPLVGMIQIPGVRYGVKGVVTLSTLVGAIENVIPSLDAVGISDINSQTEFLAIFLAAWLDASGRREEVSPGDLKSVDPQNVVYQGRILVSALSLVPAALHELRKRKLPFVSEQAEKFLVGWLKKIMVRAGFIRDGRFIGRDEFKKQGFLGSGGIGRFRDRLWASLRRETVRLGAERVAGLAEEARADAARALGIG